MNKVLIIGLSEEHVKERVEFLLQRDSRPGQLKNQQSKPVEVTVSVLKWCSSCM